MTEEFDVTQNDNTLETAYQEEDTLVHEAEEMTIDDHFQPEDDAPQDERNSSKQKIILVSIGAAILLVLLGLIIALLLFSGRNTEDKRILENVFAGGINLGGMTVEEATSALHLATDNSLAKEPLTVQIYDGTLFLYPDETNASLDVDAVVQAAYNYGRSGNHAEDQQIRKNAHKRSYTIPLLPYLSLDLDLIRKSVDNYCAALDSMYAEPVVTLVGTRPTYGDPSVQHQSMRITLGTPLRQLDSKDLYDKILDAYSMNELLLEYETPEIIWPTKITAQELFDQYCTSPQDAVLDTATYDITPEVYGYGFHVNALQKMLDDARPGETLEISLSFLAPDLLAQDISNTLFQETLVKCSSTSPVEDYARDMNLQLSCNAINGYVIKPGETFSFQKVLGDLSSSAGYSKAPISTFNDTVLGGGISQTATALYYCALHADLTIEERHNHKYTTDFIELGLDAYVDGESNDLRIRNDSGMAIRIEASANRNTVSVSLHGSKALGFTASLRTEITGKQLPTTTYQMMLPTNSQGYQDGDVIIAGIEGYQVSVLKEKTDNSTGNILSKNTVSTSEYKKRDEVIARIGVFDEIPSSNPEQLPPAEDAAATP